MNYKPDEATLIAFLYNELSGEDRKKVVVYLEEHPEVKQELEEMASTRTILGKLPDHEVSEPKFVFDSQDVVLVSKNNWFKAILATSMGIAASITLLLLVGYFTNFKMKQTDDGWQLGFEKQKEEVAQPTYQLTEEQVKVLMQETLVSNNGEIINKIEEVQQDFNDKIEQQKFSTDRQLETLKSNNQSIDESILQEYVLQLKEENKEILLSMMDASVESQQQYVNEILADFSLYLEEQRQTDLEVIQANFNNLKDNTEVGQIETNQLLASLITTVKNQNN